VSVSTLARFIAEDDYHPYFKQPATYHIDRTIQAMLLILRVDGVRDLT